jgi:hypothetical protein
MSQSSAQSRPSPLRHTIKEAAYFGGLDFEIDLVATIWFADAVLDSESARTADATLVGVIAGRVGVPPSVTSAVMSPAIISVVIIVVPFAIPIPIIRIGTTRVIAATVPLRRGDASSYKGTRPQEN